MNPAQINLTWTASTDTRSNVAYYTVYRNGASIGTSQTNSYADAMVLAATNYTYTVSAVNRDGYASAQSAAVVAALPGIVSYDWLDNQDLEIYFSEPLTAATAGVLSHYAMTGGITFSAVALSRDNTKVTLTTSPAITAHNGYTLTMTGLTTASGNPAARQPLVTTTYVDPTGTILDQVWDGLDGGDTDRRPDQPEPEPQLSEQSHLHQPT